MNVNLRDDMPFHPLKDLALITQIVSVPEILVVNEKCRPRRWPSSSRWRKRSPAS